MTSTKLDNKVKKGTIEVADAKSPIEVAINEMTTKGKKALATLETMNQEQIDHICHQMAIAGLNEHMLLAKMAVEETGRGIYEDKCIKNMFATESIWNTIKHDKPLGS